MAAKKIIAGIMAKKKNNRGFSKEESDQYESEMLLSSDTTEFIAGISFFQVKSIEPISEHELNKIVGEAKKQEEEKTKTENLVANSKSSTTEEFTEFYSGSANNANSNEKPKERLTVDEVAAELQEIQVIERKSEGAIAAGQGQGQGGQSENKEKKPEEIQKTEEKK